MAGPMDFLRNNNMGLTQLGLGLLSGKTAQEQAALGAQGLAGALQNNKTAAWLKQTNPDLAQAVQSGALTPGDAFKLAFQQKLEAEKPRNNFMSVGKNLYNTQSGEWITPPAGIDGEDAEEWGLNPVWGKDANNKTVLGQVSKSGKFKPLDTGDFSPTPGLNNVDTGTSIITRDSRTGQVISETPKNLAEAEAQKEIGTAQGKATAAAAGDVQAGLNAKDLIASIRNDPGREWGTGKTSVFNSMPGTTGYDFQRKVDQAKSGAFLTAIQQMRGLGALSNAEGQTATDAVTRMSTAQTEEGFIEALNDYERIIDQGIARAQSKLGGGAQGGKRTTSGVQWSVEP